VSAARLRVLAIALFVAAAVLSGVAGNGGGPFAAAAVACFTGGVIAFFRWRRAARTGATVFDRKEKTPDGGEDGA
jgi:hypothetical protein